MAYALSSCVSSLQSSISLLSSSIAILDSGVSDFPRLVRVLQTTRVCPSLLTSDLELFVPLTPQTKRAPANIAALILAFRTPALRRHYPRPDLPSRLPDPRTGHTVCPCRISCRQIRTPRAEPRCKIRATRGSTVGLVATYRAYDWCWGWGRR